MPDSLQPLSYYCTGKKGHPACKKGHKQGRSWHATWDHNAMDGSLVLPAYHYASKVEADAVVAAAIDTAPMVVDDVSLETYRDQKIAYRLRKGWVDPTRR